MNGLVWFSDWNSHLLGFVVKLGVPDKAKPIVVSKTIESNPPTGVAPPIIEGILFT